MENEEEEEKKELSANNNSSLISFDTKQSNYNYKFMDLERNSKYCFKLYLFHKKGALAAARMGDNVNPEKKSSGSQFYIVQGKKYSLKQLSQMENRINQNQENIFSFSDSAKKLYQEIGGTPFLDNGYTVFGEVIKGIEINDKICSVETSNGNKPINNVTILSARIIN